MKAVRYTSGRMASSPAGVLPALVTPLADGPRLDEGALIALCQRVYDAGCHGVYIGGTTGEGLLLEAGLRRRLVEVAVQHTPAGRFAIVHVGAATTDQAVDLARHAESVGAHGISSIAPPGPFSFAEIRFYYEELAAATALPLFVYFFPEVAPAITTYAQIAELCTIPNVAGVKFTGFDLYTLSRLVHDGNTVFNGRDEVLAAGLLMGASGGIGSFYNIAPGLFVDLYNATREGDWARAKRAQDRVNHLISIVLDYPLFPAIKRILGWSGIESGECLPPRRPLSDTQQAELLHRLREAGFLS